MSIDFEHYEGTHPRFRFRNEATVLEKSPIDEVSKTILLNLLDEIEKAELNYIVDRKIWYARWQEMRNGES